MSQNNFSCLPFYDAASKRFKNRAYTFGGSYPVIAEINQLPPINLVVDKDVVDVISLDIVDSSGTRTDITEEAKLVGLTVIERDNYSIVFYPSLIKIPDLDLSDGVYTAELNDGVSTWYSEEFCMKTNLDGLLKIEMCASSSIYIDKKGALKSEIYYNGNNRLYFYIDNATVKYPGYKFEDNVVRRLGRDFKLQTIHFKQYNFEPVVPEYLLDLLALLHHHQDRKVIQNGEEYDVEDIIINEPNWLGQGLASVFVEFRNDITIVTNAITVSEESCGSSDLSEGACLADPPTFVVKGFLRESTQPSYLFGYIEDENGNRYYLQENDLVLIATLPLGLVYPFRRVGSSYVFEPHSIGDTAFDENTLKYWYSKASGTGFVTVAVTSYQNASPSSDPWIVYGQGLPDTFIEIVFLDRNGQLVQGKLVTAAAIEAGVEFTWSNQYVAVGLRCGNLICGYFQASDWYYFQGFNYWAIGEDFQIEGERDGTQPDNQADDYFSPPIPL